MITVLYMTISPVLGDIYFADGQIHDIDYEINDTVWVDLDAPGMQTTVNLLDGGSINVDLIGCEDSRINILGGSIGKNVQAMDSSQVEISGGWIGFQVQTRDDSRVHISGGSIAHRLEAYNSSFVDMCGGWIGVEMIAYGTSQVNVSGGSIKYKFAADNDGTLTILGRDFVVNGEVFGYGELKSIYGGPFWEDPRRRLHCILASGEPINNNSLQIGRNGTIILTPTPGAVVLGSIGISFAGWLCRRRTQ